MPLPKPAVRPRFVTRVASAKAIVLFSPHYMRNGRLPMGTSRSLPTYVTIAEGAITPANTPHLMNLI